MVGLILGFCLGISLGSFIKVLADRSLTEKDNNSVWYKPFLGRSYCPKCKKALRWYDLFPIFSYLILGGKCRYCHKKISPEYPLVELVSGVLIAFLFWNGFDKFLNAPNIFEQVISLSDLFFKTFLISIFLAVALTDLKKTLIPDRIMFPAIVISISYLAFITIFKIYYLYYSLIGTVLGKYLLPPYSDYFRRHALLVADPLLGSFSAAIIISGFFLSLIILTKGRGMGGGDVKLGFFIGLGLGFGGGLLATILAFVTGAITSLFLIVLGKKGFKQNIPFGPFLVLGSLIVLYWSDPLLKWYTQHF